MSTPTRTAVLSNGETIVRVLGTLRYAADVDRMDAEPAADLWPDLTVGDANQLLVAAKAAGDESEWIEDFASAIRYNRRGPKR